MKNGTILSQSTVGVDPGRPAPVALLSQEEGINTLSSCESLPLYYKIIDIITLSPHDESVLNDPIEKIDELLSFAESVGAHRNRRTILRYIMINRAASPPIIRDETGLPEQSTYRTINELVKLGHIVWATPTKYTWKRKGYSSGIVAIPNFTNEDITQARDKEVERVKPRARMVQRIYQFMLDEYTNKESPTKRDIMQKVKPQFSGFAVMDIIAWVDQAIEIAQKNGTIKVWR